MWGGGGCPAEALKGSFGKGGASSSSSKGPSPAASLGWTARDWPTVRIISGGDRHNCRREMRAHGVVEPHMLDVRQLQDIVDEELVRECCGGSGFIMKPASMHPDMRHLVAAAAASISAQRERKVAHLGFICNQGYHRSVLMAESSATSLENLGFQVQAYHSSPRMGDTLCCCFGHKRRESKFCEAVATRAWRQRLPDAEQRARKVWHRHFDLRLEAQDTLNQFWRVAMISHHWEV